MEDLLANPDADEHQLKALLDEYSAKSKNRAQNEGNRATIVPSGDLLQSTISEALSITFGDPEMTYVQFMIVQENS